MKLPLLSLLSAHFIATAVVVAVPVGKEDVHAGVHDGDTDFDNYIEHIEKDKAEADDVTKLVSDLIQLQEKANEVILQAETTLVSLGAFVPHSIEKRQTTVNGSTSNGNAHINVNHRRGGTTLNTNVSFGRGGTSYGGGFTHRRGGSSFGANVRGGRGGTSWGANYGRTWNRGRTSVGLNVGRNRQQGTHGGFRLSHRF